MTPLGRLADVLARMSESPWEAHPENANDSASVGFKHFIRENGEHDWYTVATFHFDDADAIGVAALRNLAPLLITVAQAATEMLKPACEAPFPLAKLEMNLQAALTALDSAIIKELGE